MEPLEADRHGRIVDPETLPRFQSAEKQSRFLGRFGAILLAASALLLAAALGAGAVLPASIWGQVLFGNAAGLLLLTSGARSARHAAQWRAAAVSSARQASPETQPDPAGTLAEDEGPPTLEERMARLVDRWIAVAVRAIGADSLDLAIFSLAAVSIAVAGWNSAAAGGDPGTAASAAGAVALTAAFGLLVLERQLAGTDMAEWPEASPLARLARVPIALLVLSALALFSSRAGGAWPSSLAAFAGIFPMAVGLELALRALLGIFRPRDDRREPQALATSLIADLLRWPPPRLLAMLQDELQARTGVDVRRVWALTFMRRMALPVAAGVALAGWLFSGLHEVPMNGRGIYERFGRPVGVVGPGLHAGLPWPFGRVVAVEYGAVHELAAVTPKLEGGDDATPAPAEGAAPASADRLWDGAHATEKSQIVASPTNDSQSFQLVDLDIRFFYRIGLSDEAALAATYNNADLPALISNVAGRVLVRQFASRTLEDVVSAGRTALQHDIAAPLQTELDRLNSGAEIVAVVVEAIHPPAGAAGAYHGVQAAEIGAQALVVRERGTAAETEREAQTKAIGARDRATAKARESLAEANALSIRSDAERQAYDKGGPTFLLERYYDELRKGLSQAEALVVDRRLSEGGASVLDLRDFIPPAAASPAPTGVTDRKTEVYP